MDQTSQVAAIVAALFAASTALFTMLTGSGTNHMLCSIVVNLYVIISAGILCVANIGFPASLLARLRVVWPDICSSSGAATILFLMAPLQLTELSFLSALSAIACLLCGFLNLALSLSACDSCGEPPVNISHPDSFSELQEEDGADEYDEECPVPPPRDTATLAITSDALRHELPVQSQDPNPEPEVTVQAPPEFSDGELVAQEDEEPSEGVLSLSSHSGYSVQSTD